VFLDLGFKLMFYYIYRASVNKMLDDKEMLERKYGFTINVIVESESHFKN